MEPQHHLHSRGPRHPVQRHGPALLRPLVRPPWVQGNHHQPGHRRAGHRPAEPHLPLPLPHVPVRRGHLHGPQRGVAEQRLGPAGPVVPPATRHRPGSHLRRGVHGVAGAGALRDLPDTSHQLEDHLDRPGHDHLPGRAPGPGIPAGQPGQAWTAARRGCRWPSGTRRDRGPGSNAAPGHRPVAGVFPLAAYMAGVGPVFRMRGNDFLAGVPLRSIRPGRPGAVAHHGRSGVRRHGWHERPGEHRRGHALSDRFSRKNLLALVYFTRGSAYMLLLVPPLLGSPVPVRRRRGLDFRRGRRPLLDCHQPPQRIPYRRRLRPAGAWGPLPESPSYSTRQEGPARCCWRDSSTT